MISLFLIDVDRGLNPDRGVQMRSALRKVASKRRPERLARIRSLACNQRVCSTYSSIVTRNSREIVQGRSIEKGPVSERA